MSVIASLLSIDSLITSTNASLNPVTVKPSSNPLKKVIAILSASSFINAVLNALVKATAACPCSPSSSTAFWNPATKFAATSSPKIPNISVAVCSCPALICAIALVNIEFN